MKETTALKILQDEFDKRKRLNSNYSLRSYARNLGISPGNLSQIMSNKKELTPKVLSSIAPHLNLDRSTLNQLISVQAKIKKSKHVKNINKDKMKSLDMETFAVIADWYHYTILELFNLDYFETNPAWVSKKIGISEDRVKEAFANLLATKLLYLNEDGSLSPTDNYTIIQDYPFSSAAMRERQKQILALSAKKIEEISVGLRDHSSITVCVDEHLLPEIKEKIKNFRRSLGNFIAKNSDSASSVYELQIGFFPATSVDE